MRCLLLSLLIVLSCTPAGVDRHPELPGIGNHGANPGQPYVTAGDRAYLIGTQDGGSPDLGGHVLGEMAGPHGAASAVEPRYLARAASTRRTSASESPAAASPTMT